MLSLPGLSEVRTHDALEQNRKKKRKKTQTTVASRVKWGERPRGPNPWANDLPFLLEENKHWGIELGSWGKLTLQNRESREEAPRGE